MALYGGFQGFNQRGVGGMPQRKASPLFFPKTTTRIRPQKPWAEATPIQSRLNVEPTPIFKPQTPTPIFRPQTPTPIFKPQTPTPIETPPPFEPQVPTPIPTPFEPRTPTPIEPPPGAPSMNPLAQRFIDVGSIHIPGIGYVMLHRQRLGGPPNLGAVLSQKLQKPGSMQNPRWWHGHDVFYYLRTKFGDESMRRVIEAAGLNPDEYFEESEPPPPTQQYF